MKRRAQPHHTSSSIKTQFKGDGECSSGLRECPPVKLKVETHNVETHNVETVESYEELQARVSRLESENRHLAKLSMVRIEEEQQSSSPPVTVNITRLGNVRQQLPVALKVTYIGGYTLSCQRNEVGLYQRVEDMLLKALHTTSLIGAPTRSSCQLIRNCHPLVKEKEEIWGPVSLQFSLVLCSPALSMCGGIKQESREEEEEEEEGSQDVDYSEIINEALPCEVRVLAWSLVRGLEGCAGSLNFQYFFPRAHLSIQAMMKAANAIDKSCGYDVESVSITPLHPSSHHTNTKHRDLVEEQTEEEGRSGARKKRAADPILPSHDLDAYQLFVANLTGELTREAVLRIMWGLFRVGEEKCCYSNVGQLIKDPRQDGDGEDEPLCVASDEGLTMSDLTASQWFWNQEALRDTTTALQDIWTQHTLRAEVTRHHLRSLENTLCQTLGERGRENEETMEINERQAKEERTQGQQEKRERSTSKAKDERTEEMTLTREEISEIPHTQCDRLLGEKEDWEEDPPFFPRTAVRLLFESIKARIDRVRDPSTRSEALGEVRQDVADRGWIFSLPDVKTAFEKLEGQFWKKDISNLPESPWSSSSFTSESSTSSPRSPTPPHFPQCESSSLPHLCKKSLKIEHPHHDMSIDQSIRIRPGKVAASRSQYMSICRTQSPSTSQSQSLPTWPLVTQPQSFSSHLQSSSHCAPMPSSSSCLSQSSVLPIIIKSKASNWMTDGSQSPLAIQLANVRRRHFSAENKVTIKPTSIVKSEAVTPNPCISIKNLSVSQSSNSPIKIQSLSESSPKSLGPLPIPSSKIQLISPIKTRPVPHINIQSKSVPTVKTESIAAASQFIVSNQSPSTLESISANKTLLISKSTPTATTLSILRSLPSIKIHSPDKQVSVKVPKMTLRTQPDSKATIAIRTKRVELPQPLPEVSRKRPGSSISPVAIKTRIVSHPKVSSEGKVPVSIVLPQTVFKALPRRKLPITQNTEPQIVITPPIVIKSEPQSLMKPINISMKPQSLGKPVTIITKSKPITIRTRTSPKKELTTLKSFTASSRTCAKSSNSNGTLPKSGNCRGPSHKSGDTSTESPIKSGDRIGSSKGGSSINFTIPQAAIASINQQRPNTTVLHHHGDSIFATQSQTTDPLAHHKPDLSDIFLKYHIRQGQRRMDLIEEEILRMAAQRKDREGERKRKERMDELNLKALKEIELASVNLKNSLLEV